MSTLPLEFIDRTPIRLRERRFMQTRNDLEDFLQGQHHLHTKAFAKDVMFSHEIKTNNLVEGYHDDVKLVKDTIKNDLDNPQSERSKRIVNLYKGYNYILENKDINKESLKELYAILSKDLLEEKERIKMGEYYRNDKVYILKGGRLDIVPDEGLPEDRIDEFMQRYFEFLNSSLFSGSITDEYIKSQILHFYFVYIHPYFDVNGRTSRTLAMWHLLNKKAYPYIIFNRGITFKGRDYDEAIMDVKKYCDISYFIDFMLKTVHAELEKEYIMQVIASSTNSRLTATDWQTLLYLLSMRGIITVSDFTETYNRFNDKLKNKQVYETMIYPLIVKGIINVERTTQSYMFDDKPNEVIDFNPMVMQYNPEKIKCLTKYSK